MTILNLGGRPYVKPLPSPTTNSFFGNAVSSLPLYCGGSESWFTTKYSTTGASSYTQWHLNGNTNSTRYRQTAWNGSDARGSGTSNRWCVAPVKDAVGDAVASAVLDNYPLLVDATNGTYNVTYSKVIANIGFSDKESVGTTDWLYTPKYQSSSSSTTLSNYTLAYQIDILTGKWTAGTESGRCTTHLTSMPTGSLTRVGDIYDWDETKVSHPYVYVQSVYLIE